MAFQNNLQRRLAKIQIGATTGLAFGVLFLTIGVSFLFAGAGAIAQGDSIDFGLKLISFYPYYIVLGAATLGISITVSFVLIDRS